MGAVPLSPERVDSRWDGWGPRFLPNVAPVLETAVACAKGIDWPEKDATSLCKGVCRGIAGAELVGAHHRAHRVGPKDSRHYYHSAARLESVRCKAPQHCIPLRASYNGTRLAEGDGMQ